MLRPFSCRCLVSVYHRKCSVSDNTELLNFLLSIVAHSHTELFYPSSSSRNQGYTAEFGKRTPGYNSLWEVLTVTFTLIGDAFSRVGPSLSEDIWQSSIQVRLLFCLVDSMLSNLLYFICLKLGS